MGYSASVGYCVRPFVVLFCSSHPISSLYSFWFIGLRKQSTLHRFPLSSPSLSVSSGWLLGGSDYLLDRRPMPLDTHSMRLRLSNYALASGESTQSSDWLPYPLTRAPLVQPLNKNLNMILQLGKSESVGCTLPDQWDCRIVSYSHASE